MLLTSLPLPLKISKIPLFLQKPHVPTRNLSLRCSSSSNGKDPSLTNDAGLSKMVDELLKREENRELLDGLNEASLRVDRAREALADIVRQEAEAVRAKEYVSQIETRKLEIEESQRELLEARAMVDEAQRSLSANVSESRSEDVPNEVINKDLDRLESVKAASISAVIGTLASVPIFLYQDTSYIQLSLHVTFIFLSCALFGITFRYTIRRDLDNIQLKTGTSAAFGLVRGLAALGAGKSLEFDITSLISYSIDGAIYVSQSIFIFLWASVALDFCFKMKLLSPFPIRNVK